MYFNSSGLWSILHANVMSFTKTVNLMYCFCKALLGKREVSVLRLCILICRFCTGLRREQTNPIKPVHCLAAAPPASASGAARPNIILDIQQY